VRRRETTQECFYTETVSFIVKYTFVYYINHTLLHTLVKQHTSYNIVILSMKLRKSSRKTSEPHTEEPLTVTPSRWKNWWIRSLWTFLMIAGFVGVVNMGHLWMIVLVVLVQSQIYREVIGIASLPSQETQVRWFRSLSWYFLVSTNYFLYGESCIWYFKQVILSGILSGIILTKDAFLMPLAKHHRLISFSLYCAGFVVFVLNLKKGQYKFQFSQFGWTHMTLLFVVCQSHFIIDNILEGLFWFILPVSLVICNDIMAYVFGNSLSFKVTEGFFFGRTPLIRISPKKTWEGFIGAFVSTVIFSFFFSGFLAQYAYLICPAKNLTVYMFQSLNSCTPNPVFVFERYATYHCW